MVLRRRLILVNRRCVRKYKLTPVKKEDVLEIIKAAQFAPNSMNSRAWEFLVIEDKSIKEKLFEILGQDFVKEAPVLIIPVVDQKKTNNPIQDLSLASGYAFLQAAKLGLSTVWKNVRAENLETVRSVLNIPKNYLVINLIPVGYADEEIKNHSDKDFEENKIHWGKW